MTVQQMRDMISGVYDTKSWRNKVANMADNQVIAVYYNFSNRGVLNKVVKSDRKEPVDYEAVKQVYKQLSFFDVIELEK